LLKHPAYFVIIAALSGLLLFTAWATLRSLMAVYDPGPRRRLKTASWTAIGAALGSLAGGLIFIVAMGRVEPIQWWLDWGFYGGLIGGALAAALLWLDRRSA
jgi:MFS family permease